MKRSLFSILVIMALFLFSSETVLAAGGMGSSRSGKGPAMKGKAMGKSGTMKPPIFGSPMGESRFGQGMNQPGISQGASRRGMGSSQGIMPKKGNGLPGFSTGRGTMSGNSGSMSGSMR